MMTDRDRILEMVARGELSPGDASQLLEAVRKPKGSFWRWLFQPLEVLDTRAALIASGALGVAQLLISRLHIRFDGALDVHAVPDPVSVWQALVDLGLSWPLTALIFWGVFRLVARGGRLVDVVAAVGLARLPLLFSGLLSGLLREHFFAAATGKVGPVVLLASLPLLVLVVWFFTLLVTGMRTASGLRSVKLALTFVAAVVVAEVATKLVLRVL